MAASKVPAAKKDEPRLSGFASEAYEWLEAIAFALAIVVLIFTFIFRIVSVDGTSMTPTLQDKDRVLVSSMFYTPEDGDIIIIAPSNNSVNEPLVKRVIATGGQYIQIVDGVAYVGDTADTMQPYIIVGLEAMNSSGDWIDFSTPMLVPEGKVFVLGDNRNDSLDSRSSRVGLIDEDYVIGKVILRIYPFNTFGKIGG